MAVRHSQAVQRLSSATRRTESCSSRVGPISLGVKQMGARSAGNPHAACDVEGTGNVARSRGLSARQSSTLPVRGGDGNIPTYSAGIWNRDEIAAEVFESVPRGGRDVAAR